VRIAVDLVQHERFAGAFRQFRNGVFELPGFGQRRGVVARFDLDDPQVHAAVVAAASQAHRLVEGNPVQPGGERALVLESPECMPCLDEGFLCRVLRIRVIVAKSHAQSVHAAAMCAIEMLEGGQIAGLRLHNHAFFILGIQIDFPLCACCSFRIYTLRYVRGAKGLKLSPKFSVVWADLGYHAAHMNSGMWTILRRALPLLPAAATSCLATLAYGQSPFSDAGMPPTNDLPNDYSPRRVMPLPEGRQWGSTAGVDAAKGHSDIWAIDRCGSNTCVGSHVDPLLHYDAHGALIGSMGADLFAFPHGIHVDDDGNVWVTDPLPPDGRGAGGDVGQQVTKLSPDGEILLQLGTRKLAGDGPNQFSSPSDVVVGDNGAIFVADGHGEGTNERIMKFDSEGNFIMQWGRPGNGPCGAGEFSSLHALAIDSRGRLFIGDRDNNRIQIYDQNGNYLDCWYQFSRPSGIYIDADDNLFVADSESRDEGEGMDLPHPGWQRGIRVGSARDGIVRYFIPDPDPRDGSSAAEGVAAIEGGAVVYGAEVGPRAFVRYERR